MRQGGGEDGGVEGAGEDGEVVHVEGFAGDVGGGVEGGGWFCIVEGLGFHLWNLKKGFFEYEPNLIQINSSIPTLFYPAELENLEESVF